MSHRFYEGEVFHKRFKDADHKFSYDFFMLDIDVNSLSSLKTSFFSYNSRNLFSFFSKDHFGKNESFLQNTQELLEEFNMQPTKKMRFITLPRIANFIFNPISVLVLFDGDQPTQLMVEVHNYNGGRVIYPVLLEQKSQTQYIGEVKKDMYVSPFLNREGIYKFSFEYSQEKMALGVYLYEDGAKTMMTTFNATSREFSKKNVLSLFCRHTFLTFWVVTRTLWQSFRLYLKGLKFNSVTPEDEFRRY
jgi:uncharacterized protein